MTDTYGRPIQPKKTSPFVWIGLGCGILFFGFIGFIVFIGVVVIGSFRNSDPYREAVRRAQSDPRVVEALGQPIEIGLFVSGSINTENDQGTANLSIPISGPKGKAKIYVVAEKKRRRWTYSEMYVTPEKGEEINLLEEDSSPPESPDTAPPAS
jgi:hypothetical protein